MAESAGHQITGELPPTETDQSLDQPKGAVQMTELSNPQSQERSAEASSNEPPVPAKDTARTGQSSSSSNPAALTMTDTSPEGSGKGKERASIPPALEMAEASNSGRQDDNFDYVPKSPLPTDSLACRIALLHAQLSSRWTFKIDEKYLDKRGVEIPVTPADGRKDPLNLTVRTLKELILREWKTEWQTPPSSIQYIRLIYYGKFLQDDQTLSSECPAGPRVWKFFLAYLALLQHLNSATIPKTSCT
jgi:Ubiquitin-2 like Rad60 SUMO-like